MYSIRLRASPGRTATLPLETRKPWGGLATSLLFHAAAVLALVGLIRRDEAAESFDRRDAAPVAPVEMVYLAPPPRPAPEPAPEPTAEPSPPPSRPMPDAVHSAVPERARSTTPDADLPPALRTTPPPPADQPEESPVEQPDVAQPRATPPEPATETLEQQAQRLFGRPVLNRDRTRAPVQLGIQQGEAAERNAAERTNCVPQPRDPNAPVEMAELVGRVYSGSNRPLAGAFLQIVGTRYSAYSDAEGVYRLVFDASLVDECRTQYVRVVANGYRGRNLILGIGPGVNDVVLDR